MKLRRLPYTPSAPFASKIVVACVLTGVGFLPPPAVAQSAYVTAYASDNFTYPDGSRSGLYNTNSGATSTSAHASLYGSSSVTSVIGTVSRSATTATVVAAGTTQDNPTAYGYYYDYVTVVPTSGGSGVVTLRFSTAFSASFSSNSTNGFAQTFLQAYDNPSQSAYPRNNLFTYQFSYDTVSGANYCDLHVNAGDIIYFYGNGYVSDSISTGESGSRSTSSTSNFYVDSITPGFTVQHYNSDTQQGDPAFHNYSNPNPQLYGIPNTEVRAAPEPSQIGVLGLGILGLGGLRWRVQRKSASS